MDGVKTSMKIWLIIIALALLACLVALVSRPEEPVATNVSGTSGGPSFEVRVVKPRIARPLFGILPKKLEEKLEAGGERRFDNTSLSAKAGIVEQNRLELTAEGWDLFIETDGEGAVAPATRLVYTTELGGRQVRLRCRPADNSPGYLRTNTRAGSDNLDGSFLIELATCENDDSGKAVKWPPAPLTVRGSFAGLPQTHR